MSAQRKVLVGLVSYTNADGVPQVATLGQVVDLEPADVKRLEALDAVGPVDSEVSTVGTLVQPTPPVAPEEAGKLLDPDPTPEPEPTREPEPEPTPEPTKPEPTKPAGRRSTS